MSGPDRGRSRRTTPALPPEIEEVEQVDLAPLRPSAVWYWVGGSVLGGGLLVGFLLLVVGAFGYLADLEDLQRVPVPGTAEVTLDRGEVAVYAEPARRGAGPADLGLTVTGPDGTELTLGRPAGAVYATEQHRGEPLASLVVVEAGPHTVVAAAGGPDRVAIGPVPEERLTVFGVAAVVVAAGSVVVGLVLLVGTSRRRRRARAERGTGGPRSAR